MAVTLVHHNLKPGKTIPVKLTITRVSSTTLFLGCSIATKQYSWEQVRVPSTHIPKHALLLWKGAAVFRDRKSGNVHIPNFTTTA